jgi:hypothetical protein
MAEVKLERFMYSDMGTFGVLSINNTPVCLTVERPWLDNQPNISCIPEGFYKLGLRDSGIVSRTTKGRHERGYEVRDVPGRTYIMIHIANSMSDLKGCIGVGKRFGWMTNKLGVTTSAITFDEVMTALLPEEEHTIEIIFNKHAQAKYHK